MLDPRRLLILDAVARAGSMTAAAAALAYTPSAVSQAIGAPAPSRWVSAAVAPVRSAAADAMLAVLTSASGRSTSSVPAAASA